MSSRSPSGSPGFGSRSAQSRSTRTSGSQTADPPRPAKDGFEWVWYPEGYWAERSTERRTSSTELTRNQEEAKHSLVNRHSKIFKWGTRPSMSTRDLTERSTERPASQRSGTGDGLPSDAQHPLWQLPKNLPQSPYLSESEQVAALQQAVSPKSLESAPRIRDTWRRMNVEASAPLAEVISPGTKPTTAPGSSRFSWRPFHKHPLSEPSTEFPGESSEAQAAVDASPSYFTQTPVYQSSGHPPSGTSPIDNGRSGPKRVSFSAPKDRETPALVPGHRNLRKWLMMKIPRVRKDSVSSSTVSPTGSSRRNWIENSTPSSPASSDIVVQFNRQVHLPGATQSYPAGEAKHVRTPPLKKNTASGKPRSLFIDIRHAELDDNSSISTEKSVKVKPRVFSYRKGHTPEKRQWWDEPTVAVRRDPVQDASFFEFNMPEHLPNSPMCPAHPMHKGKGKLVCVYHGRAKSADQSRELAEVDE
ncbi:hypothetical protein N0V93_007438 [Gnomoniopsis smithogilvyi]|uniref:Uncharacterized protein n=1 Tax=Gnomoniopsis smithogilvyi TaxID=1191159 RepID=A0A9W8YQG0_9PEZI|nr:hypothetical protein N0V93_007438 [Gnomoniopsis smithogilvyi]